MIRVLVRLRSLQEVLPDGIARKDRLLLWGLGLGDLPGRENLVHKRREYSVGGAHDRVLFLNRGAYPHEHGGCERWAGGISSHAEHAIRPKLVDVLRDWMIPNGNSKTPLNLLRIPVPRIPRAMIYLIGNSVSGIILASMP